MAAASFVSDTTAKTFHGLPSLASLPAATALPPLRVADVLHDLQVVQKASEWKRGSGATGAVVTEKRKFPVMGPSGYQDQLPPRGSSPTASLPVGGTLRLRLWAKKTNARVGLGHVSTGASKPPIEVPSSKQPKAQLPHCKTLYDLSQVLDTSSIRQKACRMLQSQAVAIEMLKFEMASEVSRLSHCHSQLDNVRRQLLGSGFTGANAAASLFANERKSWPTFASSLSSYVDRLSLLPVLHFNHQLRLNDDLCLPDLKQDEKDINRDRFKINGNSISGSIGYRALVKHVSRLLEDPTAGCRPNDIPHPTDHIDQTTNDQGRDSSTRHSPLYHPPAGVALPQPHLTEKNSTESSDFDLTTSELRAMALLHIMNRTLTGAVCLEHVLEVFDNAEVTLVPDSRSAPPLEVIIIGEQTFKTATSGTDLSKTVPQHLDSMPQETGTATNVSGQTEPPQKRIRSNDVKGRTTSSDRSGGGPRFLRRTNSHRYRSHSRRATQRGESVVDLKPPVQSFDWAYEELVSGDDTGDDRSPMVVLRCHLRYLMYDPSEASLCDDSSFGFVDVFFLAKIKVDVAFDSNFLGSVRDSVEQQIKKLPKHGVELQARGVAFSRTGEAERYLPEAYGVHPTLATAHAGWPDDMPSVPATAEGPDCQLTTTNGTVAMATFPNSTDDAGQSCLGLEAAEGLATGPKGDAASAGTEAISCSIFLKCGLRKDETKESPGVSTDTVGTLGWLAMANGGTLVATA